MGSERPGPTTPGNESTTQFEEWQQLLTAVPTAIIQVDRDGSVIYANERGKAYLGNDSIETATHVEEAFSEKLRTLDGSPVDGDEHPFSRILTTGESLTGCRYCLYRPGDGERIVELSGAPAVTDEGDIKHVLFSLRDVTDQFEREQELERYRELLTQSPDVTLILDSDGRVQYQSSLSQTMTSVEYPNLVGKAVWEYVHSDDRERVRAAFEQVLADDTESSVHVECRAHLPSGSYRWFEAKAVNYIDTEPIDGLLVVARDIQKRKQTETRLGRYEETLRQLQETTQRLLNTADPHAAATVALDGIESVFNFSTAGIWLANDEKTRLEPVAMSDYGESLIDTQPTYTADDESLSWEAFESQTANRIDDMMQYPARQNQDTPIRSELIVPIGEFGLLNIGSKELGAFSEEDLRSVQVWSNTVESALARLDQIDQLQRREAELTRERDRLDDFASIISHDLRNLLNVAGGHLDMAISEGDLSRLQPVETAINRMDDIIGDTLTLARQGKSVDERQAVDITEIVAACLDVLDTPDVTFEVAEEFSVLADPDRLAHVFENLFRNAADHGGPGVTVTVGRTDDGFYVADSGPGIPPADRETVFESGYTTRQEGTGLGLRIVKQVVEAHGWSIAVTESNDGGARFEVSGVDFGCQ